LNQVQKEILGSIDSIKKEDEATIKAKVSFLKDFVGFGGHFVNQPVLPAVCIFELIRTIMEKTQKQKVKIIEVVSAKFYNIILPKEPVDIVIDILGKADDAELLVKAAINRGDYKKAVVKMKLVSD
jgi:3-hydroxyacyl-[acyl-carrier-protein] dehydratase